MHEIWKQFRTALILLGVFTLLAGIVYPLLITGISQLFFSRQANGSLVFSDGVPRGSALIGQQFDDPKYFWGRPSATLPEPYNASASSGSNYGPSNPALIDSVKKRIEALKTADPGNDAPIPVDLVTFSGSGLDPHISPAAAMYQAPRVARHRGISESSVILLMDRYIEDRELGILGEARVNVLLLNLALDNLKQD